MVDKANEMSFLLAGLFERLTQRGREAQAADEAENSKPSDRRRYPRREADAAALLQWIDEDDQDRAECVYIVDVSAGGCRLSLPHSIDEGWPVLITPQDRPPFKGVIRHCRQDGARWSVGVQLIRNERRRVDRRPLSCPAVLRWYEGSTEHTSDVMIRNASDGGVQLASSDPVEPEMAVTLSHEGWLRPARICYTQAESDAWIMGLQFTGEARPHRMQRRSRSEELETIV